MFIDMISLGSWIILATQVLTLVSTIVGIWSSRKNKHAIQEVHLSINSRMDELIIASRAEGKLDGLEDKRNNSGGE